MGAGDLSSPSSPAMSAPGARRRTRRTGAASAAFVVGSVMSRSTSSHAAPGDVESVYVTRDFGAGVIPTVRSLLRHLGQSHASPSTQKAAVRRWCQRHEVTAPLRADLRDRGWESLAGGHRAQNPGGRSA